MFRQQRRLNEKEPLDVFGSEFLVRSLIHRKRRRNVHNAGFLNPVGMIETETMGHARAAIMRRDQETVVTVVAHPVYQPS